MNQPLSQIFGESLACYAWNRETSHTTTTTTTTIAT